MSEMQREICPEMGPVQFGKTLIEICSLQPLSLAWIRMRSSYCSPMLNVINIPSCVKWENVPNRLPSHILQKQNVPAPRDPLLFLLCMTLVTPRVRSPHRILSLFGGRVSCPHLLALAPFIQFIQTHNGFQEGKKECSTDNLLCWAIGQKYRHHIRGADRTRDNLGIPSVM